MLLFLIFGLSVQLTQAQTPVAAPQLDSMYRVVKTDGTFLVGRLLQSDAREVLLRTEDGREIYVPQHMIKQFEPLDPGKRNARGEYLGDDKFATRYFITTNGLPIKKGEHYVQWNLFGPDFQFALADDLGVGIMTSWIGLPIIGSIKKSWQWSENTQIAVGALVGTGSWIAPDWGGALPFATLSFGDRQKNIAFSGGYGAIWDDGGMRGRTLLSVAGMVKLSTRLSLVFDSFIVPPGATETRTSNFYDWDPMTNNYILREETYPYTPPGLTLLIPGIRWHQAHGQAIQVGFTGVISDGASFPLPMVQWYRLLN